MLIKIIPEKCNGCQLCIPSCPYGALGMEGDKAILFESCVHCGICIDSCPVSAIVEVSESGSILEKAAGYSNNILVIGETADNKITKLSREILGKAREFSDIVGAAVWSIIFAGDENSAQEAINLGADKVWLLEGKIANLHKTSSLVRLISGIIDHNWPNIVFAGETVFGCDVMPRIAQRFNTGLISGCISLEIDPADKILSCARFFYGGRIMGITSCPQQRPQIVIVKEGIFREGSQYKERHGVVERIKI